MANTLLQVAVFFVRAALVAVLLAAGAAKLTDTRRFAATLRSLGVPGRWRLLIRGLAIFIPLVELGTGIAVVTGLWPLITNSVLLACMCAFSLVVAYAIAKKVRVTCRCFGALSDSQFNGKSLARNIVLALLAALVWIGQHASAVPLRAPAGLVILLVAGFLLFAAAAGQATRTLTLLKERRA